MGPSLFSFIVLIVFFLRLILTCGLWVIYVREDNHSNVFSPPPPPPPPSPLSLSLSRRARPHNTAPTPTPHHSRPSHHPPPRLPASVVPSLSSFQPSSSPPSLSVLPSSSSSSPLSLSPVWSLDLSSISPSLWPSLPHGTALFDFE